MSCAPSEYVASSLILSALLFAGCENKDIRLEWAEEHVQHKIRTPQAHSTPEYRDYCVPLYRDALTSIQTAQHAGGLQSPKIVVAYFLPPGDPKDNTILFFEWLHPSRVGCASITGLYLQRSDGVRTEFDLRQTMADEVADLETAITYTVIDVHFQDELASSPVEVPQPPAECILLPSATYLLDEELQIGLILDDDKSSQQIPVYVHDGVVPEL
jgi:hypothetical protein